MFGFRASIGQRGCEGDSAKAINDITAFGITTRFRRRSVQFEKNYRIFDPSDPCVALILELPREFYTIHLEKLRELP
ncbi:MAG: hypothetical protein QME62_03915 [Armatimonadota bacterium]|nr:hypothetical protein [Armatimonadota bacterium]